MPLELGTYISDLVVTNPAAADNLVDGDDHLRLIKSTLKTTFPTINAPLTATPTELNFVAGVISAIQTQLNTGTTNTTAAQTTASAALPKAGGTMSGPIAMGGSKITGIADGVAVTDVTSLGQANTALALKASLAGANTFTGANTFDQTTANTNSVTNAGTSANLITRSSGLVAAGFGSIIYALGLQNAAGAIKANASQLASYWTNATAAAEASVTYLTNYVAGVATIIFSTGAGLWMAGAAGGDKGLGSINATKFYENGNGLGAAYTTGSGGGTRYLGGGLFLKYGSFVVTPDASGYSLVDVSSVTGSYWGAPPLIKIAFNGDGNVSNTLIVANGSTSDTASAFYFRTNSTATQRINFVAIGT